MPLMDILSGASNRFSNWLQEGLTPQEQEEETHNSILGRILRRGVRALPVERPTTPAAGVNEYTQFRNLYGREPQQGELETTNVAPASYLAGQLSGSSIAGGAPGPRYGALYIDPRLRPATEEALRNMPRRVVDYLERTPQKIAIAPTSLEDITKTFGWRSAGVGGYATQSPGGVDIKLLGGDPGIIGHELGHAAQDVAGMYMRGIPGTARTPRSAAKLREVGYPSTELPSELAADVLAGEQRANAFESRIFDPEQFYRYLEEKFPQLPGERVREYVSNPSVEGLTQGKQAGIDWNDLFANVPDSVLNRYQELMAKAGHTADPTTKQALREAAIAYVRKSKRLPETATATYIGEQETVRGSFSLYNLNKSIYDKEGKLIHPRGSTVSKSTLERYGVPIPEKPKSK